MCLQSLPNILLPEKEGCEGLPKLQSILLSENEGELSANSKSAKFCAFRTGTNQTHPGKLQLKLDLSQTESFSNLPSKNPPCT